MAGTAQPKRQRPVAKRQFYQNGPSTMKLHIFGASGSGVTSLGLALAAKLNVPYFDSDDYFWCNTGQPFTQKLHHDERNRRISEDLNNARSWILGGSIIHWGDNVFPPFDLIVFLYLPQAIRIDRLKKREYDRYGASIFNDAERQKQFNDFIAWASDYDHHSGIANRTLKAHRAWLATIAQPVLELYGDQGIEERMGQVLDRLQKENLLPKAI